MEYISWANGKYRETHNVANLKVVVGEDRAVGLVVDVTWQ